MKKHYKALLTTIFAGIALFFCPIVNGQIIFTSTPDSTSFVGEPYSYDVEAVASPDAATYSLDVKPAGMTINASTGLISWNPANINQGGKVTVKAANSSGSYYQTFFVYVSDAVNCPSTLLSYWKMDEAVGAAPDSAIDFVSGYNAKNTTGTEILAVNAKVEKGLDLIRANQTQQYLTVADKNQYEYNRASDFSFSLWFKHTGAWNEDEVFIARGDGNFGARFVFGIDVNDEKTEGRLIFRLRDNKKFISGEDSTEWSVMSTVPITNDVWHHAVCVFDGLGRAGVDGILKVYLDKVKTEWIYAYYPPGYDFSMTDKDLTIGWFDNFAITNSYAFNGQFDEVGIWDKVLSDADVTTLYNNGMAGKAYCSVGNYAPVISSTPVAAVNEDSPYTYTLQGRDYEGTTLTKSAVVKPSWLTFNAGTGLLSGTPANANVGDTTVTLRISDGTVSVDQTFTLSVMNVNDAPVITSAPVLAVDEDAAYTYTLTAKDDDLGDIVTLSAPVLPSWLTFDPGTGILSGTPTNEQVGTDPQKAYDVTLRATDLSSAQTDQVFQITVTNINDAPVIVSKSAVSTNEDVNFTLLPSHLTVTDPDDVYPGDFTLTVKAGSNYTFAGNVITPAANYHGTLNVAFDLSDGTATVSDVINLTVTSVNDEPVFTSTPKTTAGQGLLYTYVVSATDADQDNLTYALLQLPTWLTFDAETKVLAGTPASGNGGDNPVVITVSDGTATVEQSFTIVVSITGMDDFDAAGSLVSNVYPVPASEGITFELNTRDNGVIQILSMTGKILRQIEITADQKTALVDISDLDAAFYFFKVIAGDAVQVGKIIKE